MVVRPIILFNLIPPQNYSIGKHNALRMVNTNGQRVMPDCLLIRNMDARLAGLRAHNYMKRLQFQM